MSNNLKLKKMSKIKNQYQGKSASEVWGVWTKKQRDHFILDHIDEYVEIPAAGIRDNSNLKYDKLPESIKNSIGAHIKEGQYGFGGSIKKIFSKKSKLDNKYRLYYSNDITKEGYEYISSPDKAQSEFDEKNKSFKFVSLDEKRDGNWVTIGMSDDLKSGKFKKGGDVCCENSVNERVYISFLDKKNGFKKTDKYFDGKKAYQDAMKWGKRNLENFHSDMIHYEKMEQGGNVSNKLRSVTVLFDNGYKMTTDINGTDEQIREYYKIGKQFNVGLGEKDKMAKVKSIELDSEQYGKGANVKAMWHEHLTNDEIELLCSAINRKGSGQHPKADMKNYKGFTYNYCKKVVSETNVSELSDDGVIALESLKQKMNINQK